MKSAIILFIAFFLPTHVMAQQSPPTPPVLAAKAWLLYDYTSEQVLVNENGDERIEPASISKLMTAYVTFVAIKQGKLTKEQKVTPSLNALRYKANDSRMFLRKNKSVTVYDLLSGLIVDSGNDAARVLAETVADSEESFVAMMNQENVRLGLKNTHFMNVTGLPQPQHYSTARDLALLTAALVRDFPEYYLLFSMKNFLYNGIKQTSRNRLLWLDPYVDGLKTGNSKNAGFGLVASSLRDKRRLISVVVGASSDMLRASESQRLLNYGFQYFDAVRLYQKNKTVASIRVWGGTMAMLNIGFRNDVLLTIPAGQLPHMKITMETHRPLNAPVNAGQKIGLLKLAFENKTYAEFPLYALQTVPLANVFSRGWDNIRQFFQ